MVLVLLLAVLTPSPLKASGYPINPVDLREVTVNDGFWTPRLTTNARITLGHELDELESTGRLDNFRVAAGDPGYTWRGLVFNDSDVYKVLEACAYSMELYPDPEIENRCDAIIDLIGRAQEKDGYLHTPHEAAARGQKSPTSAVRWVNEDWDHELYCAGHMYEGAVAYYEATGKRKFLDIALKNADLVCRTFNSAHDRNVSGHEEIEIGLVKLYRVTGDRRYADEARWLIDQRGRPDGRRPLMGDYAQDDRPVVDQQHAEGHAVRASYLYTAMADVNALQHPSGYKAALDRFWNDVASSQIYVTGGIGSTGANEGFTTSFDLPNSTAYCETCASVANALWNQRMFQMEGDSKYIDVAERTLYNAFLSGVGLDGKTFFYPNVLASNHGARRSPWFECACCPPNVARLLPTFATWIYAKADSRLYVNYYVGSTLHTRLGRTDVAVAQQTGYPWNGHVELKISPSLPSTFDVALRVPGWAQGKPIASGLYRFEDASPTRWTIRINGKAVAAHAGSSGYVVIRRAWSTGDRIDFELPMPVETLIADPRVKDDDGRVAFQRGPLVYCAEGYEQPKDHTFDVVVANSAKGVASSPHPGPASAVALNVPGTVVRRDLDGQIDATDDRLRLTLVPYCSWANHGRTPMTVWLPDELDKARPGPAPTLAATAKVTTSAPGGWGGEEMTDQVMPKSSIDHDHAYFHWWPRKGTHEWVQLALKQPSEVSSVRIYWFQDEGMGECRLPKAWRVLVRDNGAWIPVGNPSPYEIAKDRWCAVTFDKVKTDAVRIEVDLPANFSTGIHQIELK